MRLKTYCRAYRRYIIRMKVAYNPFLKSPIIRSDEVNVRVGIRAKGNWRDMTAFRRSFIPVRSLMFCKHNKVLYCRLTKYSTVYRFIFVYATILSKVKQLNLVFISKWIISCKEITLRWCINKKIGRCHEDSNMHTRLRHANAMQPHSTESSRGP